MVAALQMERPEWLKKAEPYLLIVLTALVCCLLSTTGYSCDVWTKAETASKDIYTNLRHLSTYVAGAMFLVAMLFVLISKDQRKVDIAIDWAKKIFVAYLVILGAGWLFQWGRDLMADAPDIFG